MQFVKNSDKLVETKLFHLSSMSGSGELLNGDYKSRVRYNIPGGIIFDDSIDYIYWSVRHAVIPNSFYIINDTNNQLDISYNGITAHYIFENGNYNVTLFIKKFKEIVPNTFSIFFDQINNKFTISNSTYDFVLLGRSSIDYILGFSTDLYSDNKFVTLTRCCNFLPLPRVNIRCSQLTNSSIMLSSEDTTDIILSIPNNSKMNSQIIYHNVSGNKHLFKNDRFDNFTLELTDDDNNYINFNGLSWFLTIQFEICRKTIEKPLDFKNLLKYIYDNQNK